MTSRREFLKKSVGAAAAVSGLSLAGCAASRVTGFRAGRPPNIVLIITDDHGYGDLGCHGNPDIRTPNLDRLHGEGVRFTRFYVSPVCSPTRSCLMTGRYNYRTGIVDTYMGRSMMYPDETTIAELLAAHGYRTGIFGKWHLGDNYPMRAMDQGFQESLVLKGGGLCQPSEPRTNSYFDPLLKLDGEDRQFKGYCTDIFTDAALEFIETHRDRPFFAYLATNAPHEPLIVAERYSAPYAAAGLDERTAKVYGMIENIDDNVGRVLAKLGALGLADNTIVIFMTDNGPAFSGGVSRYNAGMRGSKGTVYEGGIRVPFFVRWPAQLPAGRDIGTLAAHLDVFPTLLEAAGVSVPRSLRIDGRSLLPLIRGTATDWPDRTLYFQWHRGDVPQPYNNCAAVSQRFKLIDGKELYDLESDPGEQNDLAAQSPDVVRGMREGYDRWFAEVGAERGYAPPRIFIGTRHENPAMLTRQDWRGAESWHDGQNGYWEINAPRRAVYEIALEFPSLKNGGTARFACNGTTAQMPLRRGAVACTFRDTPIPAGAGRLEAWIEHEGKREGVSFLWLRRT